MPRSLARRRPLATLFVAVTAAVLAQVSVLAWSASADNRPAVTVSAPEVVGADVTFAVTVNRSVKAIDTTVCTLLDADEVETVVDCGAATPGATRHETGFSVSVTGLAGDHELRVSVTLTDGGTATASAPVTVEPVDPVDPVEPADARSACAALPGGVFVEQDFWWQAWNCDFEASTTEMVAAQQPVFEAFCDADGGIQFASIGTVPGTYTFGCWLI